MLHNISLYPGLTEEQLCRFFPEKEATAKTLLAHMLKEGRIFCTENSRYYANQEAQNGADKDLSCCVWVLLDFIDQVEYHTVGEFPAAILCFANGELYEIVPIPQGKETMICQLLRQPQKDTGKRIVVVEDRERCSHRCRHANSILLSAGFAASVPIPVRLRAAANERCHPLL